MSDNIEYQKKPGNGKVAAGLILLVIGAVLLIEHLDFFFFPGWIFSWPMWLIGIGVYQGSKHQFKNAGPVIMILVGIFFLIDDIFPAIHTSHLFWPVVIIATGVYMILGRHGGGCTSRRARREAALRQDAFKQDPFNPEAQPVADYTAMPGDEKKTNAYAGDDYLDSVSVFGGVKKTILSKDFKGGEIVNIFGGAEIDLTQADINGRVIIDVTQIFGGIKLFVPAHWQVVSDTAAIFAGVDDKRRFVAAQQQSPDKILVLKGVSIFAGIDIRSF